MNLFLKSLCVLVLLLSPPSFASDSKVDVDDLAELRQALNTPSVVNGALTRGDCINGHGLEATAIVKPKEILEGARYQPEDDGFLVFDLPAGYVTDSGVRVNLKNEVTIYQEGKKELELIHMVERRDSIYIRVITYVNMNSGKKCVETKWSIPLSAHKKSR